MQTNSEPLLALAPERDGALDRRRRIIAIVGASSGNLVEWYDFYIYAFTSIYFASAFFPAGDTTSQLLATAGIFAVGFFMRPLGGWLFGWIADTHGRKTAMVDLGAADVRRLVDGGPAADLRGDRCCGAGALVGRPPGPRPFGRWRVRDGRNLHERGGGQGAPRILLVIPVRHPDRRPAPGSSGAGDPAAAVVGRGIESLGMACSLRHRCHRRRGGDVSAPVAGRDRLGGDRCTARKPAR